MDSVEILKDVLVSDGLGVEYGFRPDLNAYVFLVTLLDLDPEKFRQCRHCIPRHDNVIGDMQKHYDSILEVITG